MTHELATEVSATHAMALQNPHRHADSGVAAIPQPDDDVRDVHRVFPGYEPTPLRGLDSRAVALGLGSLHVKDESKRFGLNAFKSLGATYATYRVLRDEWNDRFGETFTSAMMLDGVSVARLGPKTLCAATAGNHGRALAWVAQQCGLEAVILVPKGTAAARMDRITEHGARVVEVEGNYDATVLRAAEESLAHGWSVIADFGSPGYTTIPMWIESGYSTMILEIDEQLDALGAAMPDIVMLQGGAGCFSAGAVRAIRHRWTKQPRIVVVEPLNTASFRASASTPDGTLAIAGGSHETVCGCLSCPTPSSSSWPTLRAGVDVFMAIDDESIERTMRSLAHPDGDDPAIVSGPAGAAGLAGLAILMQSAEMAPIREALDLGSSSRVLAISTEGDTDPVHYHRVMSEPGA